MIWPVDCLHPHTHNQHHVECKVLDNILHRILLKIMSVMLTKTGNFDISMFAILTLKVKFRVLMISNVCILVWNISLL